MIAAFASRSLLIHALRLTVCLALVAIPVARLSAQPATDEDRAASTEPSDDDSFSFDTKSDDDAEPSTASDTASETTAADEVASPASADAPATDAATDNGVSSTAPTVDDSAAVSAIRDAAPQTAVDRLRAIDQLLRLRRADVAQSIWADLQKMTLDDPAKIALLEALGSATLFRLDRANDLKPAPHDLVQSIFAAAKQRNESPEALAKWAGELASPDRLIQYRAAQHLWQAGPPAIPTLLDVVAHRRESTARRGALAVLQKMGTEALDALQTYQTSPEESLRAAAITAQSWIGDPRSLPYLVGPYFAPQGGAREFPAATHAWQQIAHGLPDRAESIRLLEQAADRAYRGDAGVSAEPLAEISRWVWSQETQRGERRTIAARDAAIVTAARLYHELARLEPHRADLVQRATIAHLEATVALRGTDTRLSLATDPAVAAARSQTTDERLATLAAAMRDRHDGAAVVLCQLLSESHDRLALSSNDGRTTALAEPSNIPARRVRFAAAESLAELGPPQAFAGAGRWADTLLYLSRARGRSVIVVAHPQLESARHIGATFGILGYQGHPVTSVKELWRTATSNPDVELIAISDAMNEVTTWSLIESLRVDPKTARIPIVILARTARYEEDLQIAEQQPRTLVLAESLDEELLTTHAPRLRQLAGRDIVPVETRLEHANAAIRWLAKVHADPAGPMMAFDGSSWQEILSAALHVPDLAASAAETLTGLASSTAQRTLVNTASDRTIALASRQLAAAAFGKSIDQHGLLLTRSQIREQYDRYNQSRDADAETQSLLSSILDGIERHANQSSRAKVSSATGG